MDTSDFLMGRLPSRGMASQTVQEAGELGNCTNIHVLLLPPNYMKGLTPFQHIECSFCESVACWPQIQPNRIRSSSLEFRDPHLHCITKVCGSILAYRTGLEQLPQKNSNSSSLISKN